MELIELVQNVEKSVADFQKANDKRWADAKAEGAAFGKALGELEDKTDKHNADIDKAMDELRAHMQTLNKRVQLAGEFGGDQNALLDEGKQAKKWAQWITGNPNAEADLEAYRAYRKAFGVMLKQGDRKLTPEMSAALFVGDDTKGGYLVPPDMSGGMVKLLYETSPVRQVARVISTSRDAVDGFNDLDQAASGWVGETASRAETDTPDIGHWRIPVHEQYANPKASQTVLDDAETDVEGWLIEKIVDILGRTENTAFVNGNGIGKPRGFLTYAAGTPSATTWNVIEQIASGASGAFPAAGSDPENGLIDMITALKAGYRQGASWAMRRAVWGTCRKLKDSQGQSLFGTTLLDGVMQFQLLGFPVNEWEDMPALAADSLSIAFANWQQAYTVVDRIGVRVLRDPFTAKPYVHFYTTKRVGGDVTNFEAIKLMKFATSV